METVRTELNWVKEIIEKITSIIDALNEAERTCSVKNEKFLLNKELEILNAKLKSLQKIYNELIDEIRSQNEEDAKKLKEFWDNVSKELNELHKKIMQEFDEQHRKFWEKHRKEILELVDEIITSYHSWIQEKEKKNSYEQAEENGMDMK